MSQHLLKTQGHLLVTKSRIVASHANTADDGQLFASMFLSCYSLSLFHQQCTKALVLELLQRVSEAQASDCSLTLVGSLLCIGTAVPYTAR